MIQLSIGGAITLLVGFITVVLSFGLLLLKQFEKRMNDRFDSQEKLRRADNKSSVERLAAVERDMERLIDRQERLSVKLPLEYVRREDWIRFGTTIDAKIDKLAELLMRILPQAGKQG